MPYSIPDQYVGMMPNQITGELNGRGFYFRARHGGWSLSIGEECIASGDAVDAGWWEQDEAIKFCKGVLDGIK